MNRSNPLILDIYTLLIPFCCAKNSCLILEKFWHPFNMRQFLGLEYLVYFLQLFYIKKSIFPMYQRKNSFYHAKTQNLDRGWSSLVSVVQSFYPWYVLLNIFLVELLNTSAPAQSFWKYFERTIIKPDGWDFPHGHQWSYMTVDSIKTELWNNTHLLFVILCLLILCVFKQKFIASKRNFIITFSLSIPFLNEGISS